MFSIHDAEIIKYCVDFENKKIIFKVCDFQNNFWEVIFSNVWAFEILNPCYQNIILDISEYSWEDYLSNDYDFSISVLKNFFYNIDNNYDEIHKLAIKNNIKVFDLFSSIWLYWTIFAEKIEKKLLN